MVKKKYIIYVPDYTEDSGGIIMLHLLCHLLNKNGCEAYLWRQKPPIFTKKKLMKRYKKYIVYLWKTLFKVPVKINNEFITPCATKKDLNDSIVVYAEMIPGNPLKVKNVVRWFLHQPGNRTGSINYKETDLIFYYREQFNVYRYDKKYMLDLIYIKDDIYVNEGRKRKGTCYILRKGEGRKLEHNVDGSILIDDLTSDTEIAEVFKSTECCISYDSYTMLSKYAAMCGCISIVVPENDISKEVWRPRVEDRYGIAYGFNDIQWALDTMEIVKKEFLKRKALSNVNVKKFIEITNSHFN